MMTAARIRDDLMDRLPKVRGRLEPNAPLAKLAWFRVGGPAEVLFAPADREDLQDFLATRPAGTAVTVIGVASNLLVRDGGVPGVVVRLGRPFAAIDIEGTRVRAGAAAMDVNVARACRDAGIAGLEFLSGIPGTIGGALRMNAGAYGHEIADVVVSVDTLDPKGGRHVLTRDEMGFGYRKASVADDWIFVEATLQGRQGDSEAITRRMDEIAQARESSQPMRTRTGGSTFANPSGHKAWELIERAGCRGLRRGGAMVSNKHCNFLVNTGDATAADIEELGEEIRRRVKATTGIGLEWEIRRVGVPRAEKPGGAS